MPGEIEFQEGQLMHQIPGRSDSTVVVAEGLPSVHEPMDYATTELTMFKFRVVGIDTFAGTNEKEDPGTAWERTTDNALDTRAETRRIRRSCCGTRKPPV